MEGRGDLRPGPNIGVVGKRSLFLGRSKAKLLGVSPVTRDKPRHPLVEERCVAQPQTSAATRL